MGAIRLFLAFAVVFEHLTQQVLEHRGLHSDVIWIFNVSGARAVVFFFVISGFLISYVLDRKYPVTRAGTFAFYRSRALRIYPLWWAVLALCVVMNPHVLPFTHLLPATTLIGLDWLIPFWSYPSFSWDNLLPAATAPAWTLGAELTFYLMAPFVLRSNWLAGTLLVASAAIRFVCVNFADPHVYIIWTYFFFPSTLMFFLMGHFAQRLYRHVKIDTWPSVELLIAAAVLSSMHSSPSVDNLSSLLASICFALSLPGIFAATKDNRVMNLMGDLTYPLYLTHSLVIAALFWPWETLSSLGQSMLNIARLFPFPTFQSVALLIMFFGVALIVAALTHFSIERRLERVGRFVLDALTRGRVEVKPPADAPLAETVSSEIRLRSAG